MLIQRDGRGIEGLHFPSLFPSSRLRGGSAFVALKPAPSKEGVQSGSGPNERQETSAMSPAAAAVSKTTSHGGAFQNAKRANAPAARAKSSGSAIAPVQTGS